MKVIAETELKFEDMTTPLILEIIQEATQTLKLRCGNNRAVSPQKKDLKVPIKRSKKTRNWKEIDEFVLNHYGTMSVDDLVIKAKSQGIDVTDKQIYYRKIKLGLTNDWVRDSTESKSTGQNRSSQEFIEKLDNFIKENYIGLTVNEIVEKAREAGIETNIQQVKERKKKWGLRRNFKANPIALDNQEIPPLPAAKTSTDY